MKNILVSVIIPVFNGRPFLKEALDSVLRQSYEDLEIIIIDDGSTDGSEWICDKYAKKDNRIHVIHQKNKGLSSARNAGLHAMTGEVVAFLDSDDAYHPDFIRSMISAMIREKADLVLCRFTAHETNGKLEQKKEKKVYPVMESGAVDTVGALCALAEERMNKSVWNKLYRRELWKDICFPEGHVYEDINIIYRIIQRSVKIFVLDQALYLHRNRPESITGTSSAENIRDWFHSFSDFELFVRNHIPEIFSEEQLQEVRRSKLARMIVFYAGFREGQGEEGKKFAEKLRRQIIRTGRDAGIQNCGLKTRTGYLMVCLCPHILKKAYPVYLSVRRFIRTAL